MSQPKAIDKIPYIENFQCPANVDYWINILVAKALMLLVMPVANFGRILKKQFPW